MQGLVTDGVNCLLTTLAGPSSGVVDSLIDKIKVNDNTSGSGKFVKCTKTTHLSTFVSLKSNSVEEQCDKVVSVVRDVSNIIQKVDEESCGPVSFAEKVLEHPGLTFATTDLACIEKLNRK